jgi:hypothetical protein
VQPAVRPTRRCLFGFVLPPWPSDAIAVTATPPLRPARLPRSFGTPGEPLSPSSVSNAIKLAKNAGWIGRESSSRCLVVPPHAVQGGIGHPNERCPIHGAPVVSLHVPREETG